MRGPSCQRSMIRRIIAGILPAAMTLDMRWKQPRAAGHGAGTYCMPPNKRVGGLGGGRLSCFMIYMGIVAVRAATGDLALMRPSSSSSQLRSIWRSIQAKNSYFSYFGAQATCCRTTLLNKRYISGIAATRLGTCCLIPNKILRPFSWPSYHPQSSAPFLTCFGAAFAVLLARSISRNHNPVNLP